MNAPSASPNAASQPAPAAGAASSSLPLSRLLGHAADAVQAVRAGRSLDGALAACPADARPGTQALAFHAMRWLGGAQAVRARLAPKPPAPAVDALLLTALALLWPADAASAAAGVGDAVPDTAAVDAAAAGTTAPDAMDPEAAAAAADAALPYPAHTLVDQAVTAARQRRSGLAGAPSDPPADAAARAGTARDAAFINAVLRRFLRERTALVRAARRDDPLARYDHPAWWVERLRLDWPAQWQPLLRANQHHPPMTLRVNARRGDVASYLRRLAAAGIAARAADPAVAPHALLLAQPCPVSRLPGFADGDVSVQDAAAQRAAPLLIGLSVDGSAAPARPLLPAGARVLDACAAPGGKTAHLLELAELDLLAIDSDAQRLGRVDETLARLQLRARTLTADAGDPAAWWDGRPFDAILLDAPCSASGIVRRHPDVRWLRRAGDIGRLARTQGRLLDALWPLLATGGRLLYATCSVFKAEGRQPIDAFLQRHRDARPAAVPASPGHLLPLADNDAADAIGGAGGDQAADGFFYALIEKH